MILWLSIAAAAVLAVWLTGKGAAYRLRHHNALEANEKLARQLEERVDLVGRLTNALAGERQEHSAKVLEWEQREHELVQENGTLGGAIAQQASELQAVHRELVTSQEVALRTLADAAEARADVRELTRQVLEGFVSLRRDGFNPAPAFPDSGGSYARSGVAFAAPAQAEASDGIPAADKVHKWLRIVEAIQERAGGDAVLQSSMTADAERWRALNVPFEEIEKRVWEGHSE